MIWKDYWISWLFWEKSLLHGVFANNIDSKNWTGVDGVFVNSKSKLINFKYQSFLISLGVIGNRTL